MQNIHFSPVFDSHSKLYLKDKLLKVEIDKAIHIWNTWKESKHRSQLFPLTFKLEIQAFDSSIVKFDKLNAVFKITRVVTSGRAEEVWDEKNCYYRRQKKTIHLLKNNRTLINLTSRRMNKSYSEET